jgi:hypothetical protein
MTCTGFSASPGVPQQWIPWQVLGGTMGLPPGCGAGQALQWRGGAWACGDLGPYCPSLSHPARNCPVPPPFCPATGTPQSPCPQFCPSTATYIPQGTYCAPLPYCAFFRISGITMPAAAASNDGLP